MRLPRIAALVLLLPAAAIAGWPPGAEISPAVAVDLTKDGLSAAADLIPMLLPTKIDVPDMSETGEVDYWLGTWDWGLYVTNVWVGTRVIDAEISPGSGVLNVDGHAEVWVNDSSDRFNVTFDTDWGTWADCDSHINTFNLWIASTVSLTVVDDGVNPPWLDATMGDIVRTWDVTNDHVDMDCWVGDMDTILDYVGLSPIDMALDYAGEEIDKQLAEMRPDIEAAIEEAFAAANFEEQLDLNGTTMNISIYPDNVEITPAGVRVSAAGSFSSDTHPCVLEYGHVESLETPSTMPDIATAPVSVPAGHHLGILMPDDFVNQGLYAAYNGGLLCYTVSDGGDLPINTTLLSVLSQEAFGPLFPESKPLIVQTRPAEVPIATPDGAHDINLEVRKLGVDFMAELDYRNALMVGLDIDADAGIDLAFDDTTGNLSIGVALAPEDMLASVRHNEFAAGRDAEIAEAVTGLFDMVIGPLLGGITEGISFPMPSMSGMGLTWLQAEASGANGDLFGVYGGIGPVTYTNDGGCSGDGAGCGSGCGTGAVPARTILFLVPLLVAGLRRRRA